MLIMTQCRTMIVNTTGLCITTCWAVEGQIIAYSACKDDDDEGHFLLGRYESMERAKEVLRFILRVYSESIPVFSMPEK